MSVLNKSIVLFLLITISQNNGVTGNGLSLDYGHELVEYHTEINKAKIRHETPETRMVGGQTLPLQSIYLTISVIICSLFLYTIYKINQLNRRIGDVNPQFVTTKTNLLNMTNEIETLSISSVNGQAPFTVTARDIKWLEKFDELIKNELSNDLLKTVDLAEHMGVCERQLQRKLKELKGISPAKYLKQARLEMGHQYLKSGDFQTISEVAYQVGYRCPNNFSRSFKRFFGMNPKELLNAVVLV